MVPWTLPRQNRSKGVIWWSQSRKLDRAETIFHLLQFIYPLYSPRPQFQFLRTSIVYKHRLRGTESRWLPPLLPPLLQTLNPSMSATSMSCSIPVDTIHPAALSNSPQLRTPRSPRPRIPRYLPLPRTAPFSCCASTDCTFRQSSTSACWATEGAHRRDMRTTQTTAMTP